MVTTLNSTTEKDFASQNPYGFTVDYNSFPSSPDDYLPQASTKTNICLHHTAGSSLSGAIETLKKPDYIAVHFIVGQDGTIVQCFPLKNWSYHLGIKNSGGKYDLRTIGIEVCNVGALVRKGDRICYWPNNWTAKYCDLADTSKYFKLQTPWRGIEYWATYPKPQCDAVSNLVAYLCYTQKIEPKILPNVDEYQLENIDGFNGIFTHTSVRKDKYDIGKGWPWAYFETSMNAAYKYYSENPMFSVPMR